MSEVDENSTTDELLDFLACDCEWAAEVVRERIQQLEMVKAERDAYKKTLRQIATLGLSYPAQLAREVLQEYGE